jgi:nucleotide-binding universal stress UspA family protein
MFTNVLVGVDGRSSGRDAVALARRLAAPGTKLTLAHVRAGFTHPLQAATPVLLAEEAEESERLLREELEHAGGEASTVSVVAGAPGAGLHSQAEQQGADLLVVGSCSRGLLGRAMIGDDTRASLNGAPCAVAIASRGYDEHPRPLKKVGVAYNGSPEASHALEVAREVAGAAGAELHALEIVSIPTYAFTGLIPAAFGETVDVMLAEADARMHALEGVQGRAVYGLAGEELAAFGDELDLLVAGSRGYGPVHRLVSGSTTDYLQRHARCSLLVLPRREAAEQ